MEWVKDNCSTPLPERFNSSIGRIASDSKSVAWHFNAENLLSGKSLNSRSGKLHSTGKVIASKENDLMVSGAKVDTLEKSNSLIGR